MQWSRRLISITRRLVLCAMVPTTALIAACAVPPVNTAQLSMAPGTPLVARKIQRPLVIVLDPQLVPDEFVMSSMKKQVHIREIREFVRRDLRGAMQNFFKNVDVVGPDAPIVPSAHVAHVRIDRFDGQGTFPQTAGPGMNSQVYGRITWSFAILPSKGRDYLFSYSDTITGDYPLLRIGEIKAMVESTYVRAIEVMVQRFIEDGAYRAFIALDEAPRDPPCTAPTEAEAPPPSETTPVEEPDDDDAGSATPTNEQPDAEPYTPPFTEG